MSLKAQITEDMKTAMRAKDASRLSTIRLVLAEVKRREVDERIELTDADVMAIMDKLLKQRRDSLSAFEAAGREDLASVERAEMMVIQAYMPTPLTEAEIDAEVVAAIANTGAKSAQDMGKVMAILKPALAGRVDMAQVSKAIKARLS